MCECKNLFSGCFNNHVVPKFEVPTVDKKYLVLWKSSPYITHTKNMYVYVYIYQTKQDSVVRESERRTHMVQAVVKISLQ